MTELRIESYTMPAGLLGEENPLPPLHAFRTPSASVTADIEGAAETNYPDRGHEGSILPYRLQDAYSRTRTPHTFKTAVLENNILRATFLLEQGGRLWSLFHKPTNRELLHVNPVFQPANLAVRDAWFSGGVEWNISIIGHSPFTCSPLFAAKVHMDDGTPMLRLYEFERIRRVVFQIDCYLPDNSSFLLVRPRITNPNDCTVPMYWWSNAAVNELDGTRVLGPAHSAYFHDYDGSLKTQDVPIRDGKDMTYPTQRQSAADMYFRIPETQRPWVTSLDQRGHGMIHTSTPRLRGRKMFVWGMAPGGRHWQEFLSQPGQQYVEIQGGLACTQTEYIPMPAGARWEWLEAYGAMQADPTIVHGPDWQNAVDHLNSNLESALPAEWMSRELDRTSAAADRVPSDLLQSGSGWGALECQRRGSTFSPAIPFPKSSIERDQQPWLNLLEKGELPYRPPSDLPGAYMVQAEWQNLLESFLATGRGVHWLSWLHLGIMRYRAHDPAGAKEAFEQSLALEPSAWALRNLAVLALDAADENKSADHWHAAARMKPDLLPLAIEAGIALLRVSRYQEAIEFINQSPPQVAGQGRVKLLAAKAALGMGDLKSVADFFAAPCEIASIREHELSLSDLWFDFHAAKLAKEEGVEINESLRSRVERDCPPPKEHDFRMR